MRIWIVKAHFSSSWVCLFLISVLLGLACKGPVNKALSPDHPKLVKTIGSPNYGNVQCILQDKAGNLWFGTTENGLYKYDGKTFTRYLVADGLNSNNIYSLLEDKEGKIWIGTYNGLCLYDPLVTQARGGKIFKEISIPIPQHLPPNNNPGYSDSHWVYSMLQAKSGKIWFATIDGVYLYDGESFRYFEIKEMENGFLGPNGKVERLFEDNEGNMWFGARTNQGAYRYDGKTVTKFTLEPLMQNGPKPKPHQWAWPQWQDSKGNIWFSNWGGAYRFDGKSFTSFTKKDGLSGDMVASIMEDSKGNIWFGGDGGISRYDGQSFARFTTKDGLTSPGCWSMLEDKSGNIWVGTRATGLYLFDGNRFIAYSEYAYKAVAEYQTKKKQG